MILEIIALVFSIVALCRSCYDLGYSRATLDTFKNIHKIKDDRG